MKPSQAHNTQGGPLPVKGPRRDSGSAVSRASLSGEQIAVRIQQVLANRGLTLSDVSRESRLRFGKQTAYRISHHFYADLRSAGFSPRMEQVLAFSAITNHRLVDWLALLGFRLDDLTGLAASLPAARTMLLDGWVYDKEAWVEWFRSRSIGGPLPSIAPLGQLLEPGPPQQLKSLLPPNPSPFLYAKVGRQDAFAFPDLLPGSIVRVDTRLSPGALSPGSQSLYLVEHSKGLACCRLHVSKGNFVTLRSTELAYAEVELQLGREARILGKLDLEFRFVENAPSPEVARDLALFWKPQPVPHFSARRSFAELVAQGRRRAGLSLREASARSRDVAEALGDRRFFCSRGTLGAWETTGRPPRHLHKILALCTLYSLAFREVLGAAGWKTEGLGRDPISHTAVEREPGLSPGTQEQRHGNSNASGFLPRIVKEFEEIPFFFRDSLGALMGLEGLSLRDIVWLGGRGVSLHPYLAGAVFAAVNRKQRKPPSFGKESLWKQPLYLLLQRDGSYLCARCTLQDKLLILAPFADGFDRPVRLRNGVDAEVVGRVAALVRRL